MRSTSRRAFLRGDWKRLPELVRSTGPVVIGPGCLALNRVVCRSCADRCEAGAIRFRLVAGGLSRPELSAERCNRCGDCVAVCPAAAITVQSHIEETA